MTPNRRQLIKTVGSAAVLGTTALTGYTSTPETSTDSRVENSTGDAAHNVDVTVMNEIDDKLAVTGTTVKTFALDGATYTGPVLDVTNEADDTHYVTITAVFYDGDTELVSKTATSLIDAERDHTPGGGLLIDAGPDAVTQINVTITAAGR